MNRVIDLSGQLPYFCVMATHQINQYFDIPLGRLKIWSDPKQLEKAKKLVEEMPEILEEAYYDAAMRWGGKLKKEARKCLDRNQPPSGVSWPPLSERYVESMGGDDRRYMKGLQYYESIDIHKEAYTVLGTNKSGNRVYVGLPNGVKKLHPLHGTKETRLTLSQVAKILENGTRNGKIPPRPLWKPLYDQLGGKKSIERYVINAIKRKLNPYID